MLGVHIPDKQPSLLSRIDHAGGMVNTHNGLIVPLINRIQDVDGTEHLQNLPPATDSGLGGGAIAKTLVERCENQFNNSRIASASTSTSAPSELPVDALLWTHTEKPHNDDVASDAFLNTNQGRSLSPTLVSQIRNILLPRVMQNARFRLGNREGDRIQDEVKNLLTDEVCAEFYGKIQTIQTQMQAMGSGRVFDEGRPSFEGDITRLNKTNGIQTKSNSPSKYHGSSPPAPPLPGPSNAPRAPKAMRAPSTHSLKPATRPHPTLSRGKDDRSNGASSGLESGSQISDATLTKTVLHQHTISVERPLEQGEIRIPMDPEFFKTPLPSNRSNDEKTTSPNPNSHNRQRSSSSASRPISSPPTHDSSHSRQGMFRSPRHRSRSSDRNCPHVHSSRQPSHPESGRREVDRYPRPGTPPPSYDRISSQPKRRRLSYSSRSRARSPSPKYSSPHESRSRDRNHDDLARFDTTHNSRASLSNPAPSFRRNSVSSHMSHNSQDEFLTKPDNDQPTNSYTSVNKFSPSTFQNSEGSIEARYTQEGPHHLHRYVDSSTTDSIKGTPITSIPPTYQDPGSPIKMVNPDQGDVLPSSPNNAPRLSKPCHHVPGLWFVKTGHDGPDIVECEFEVDEETTTKWGLLNKSFSNAPQPNPSLETQLSLHLLCLPVDQVKYAYEATNHSLATPEDLGVVFSEIKPDWPTKGHLVVQINPDQSWGKTWLPIHFDANTSALDVTAFTCQGKNIVRFIQLADLSKKVFVLLATPSNKEFGNSTKTQWLDFNTLNMPPEVLDIQPAVVQITQ